MKLIHNGTEYEIDFFFGTDGTPQEKRTIDTPHVRTRCDRSFNCEDCTFPGERVEQNRRKRTIGFHRDTDEGFE